MFPQSIMLGNAWGRTWGRGEALDGDEWTRASSELSWPFSRKQLEGMLPWLCRVPGRGLGPSDLNAAPSGAGVSSPL